MNIYTFKGTLKLSAVAPLLLAMSTYANDCSTIDNDKSYKHCDNQIGWYLGGELGFYQTNINQDQINTYYEETGFDASTSTIDDSAFAFSLMAGYQLNTYWAIEGSYIDLGERSVSFTGSTEDLDAFYDNVEHVYPESGSGLSLAAVASLPISDNFKISGKLGYWSWKGDYTTSDANGDVGSDSIKGNDVWYGAELNYRLNQHIQMYLTAQRFKLDRDENDLFALGIRYYFGN
ncbi:outer membrane beta-barrel protein [Colwellia sp. E2M01]|uniref:outer membrane beta-barrel protein n=1 Tax=Colwellia sp. E2M01 TaxID=2841561 RepID=UPI001C07F367|nr:outer membrane beta-barrel protein [Colwellia sp. E2M01]MBU2869114.1 outer membrane beta-barrel protein [Colwellia sp. E2M01]